MILIIDSTEFKQDRGLNKENLSLIKGLGEEKLLTLHIPWFVYKESSSSSIYDVKTELNTIMNQLKSFDRKGMDKEDYATARNISEQVEVLYKNMNISNEKLWTEFIEESNSILHEYNAKDSILVFNAYFDGGKPFKSLKNRQDIPDAFIYETIQRLAQIVEVHLVSSDKNLLEKCDGEKNIIIHNGFDELLKNEEFKKIETEYRSRKATKRIEDKKLLIIESKDNIKNSVDNYLSKISSFQFKDIKIPSDDHTATINAIDDVVVTIDKNSINYISGKYFVPILVSGNASIDYAIFKNDYWMMEDSPAISEDISRHYFLIEDTVPIRLKKLLIFDEKEINEDEELKVEISEFDKIWLH